LTWGMKLRASAGLFSLRTWRLFQVVQNPNPGRRNKLPGI